MNILKTIALASLIIAASISSAATQTQAQTSLPQDHFKASILSYHDIKDSLDKGTFQQHIRLFKNKNYTVVSLPDIQKAFKATQRLPARTLAITFHGAYRSSYKLAMQKLLEDNIPFTLFYNPNTIGQLNFLSKHELLKLKKHQIVSFGITTTPDKQNLNSAITKHREIFHKNAPYFAYPYGKFTQKTKDHIKTSGFQAAFGLHSGPFHQTTDPYEIPRFSITGAHSSLERLEMIANTLPLPVSEISKNPAGFTLPGALANEAENLNCFTNTQNKPNIEILGARVEIRINSEQPLLRINCTMPGPKRDKFSPMRWRWLGLLINRNK